MDFIVEQKILESLKDSMKFVKTLNGYNYSFIDDNIFINQSRDYESDKTEKIVVYPFDDGREQRYQNQLIGQKFLIELVVNKSDLIEDYILFQRIKADLKEAIFAEHFLVIFSEGSSEVGVGDYIQGDSSGAYGFVERINPNSSLWDGSETGNLWIRRKSREDFEVGESVSVIGGDSAVLKCDFFNKVDNIGFPEIPGVTNNIHDYAEKIDHIETKQIVNDDSQFIISVGMLIEIYYKENNGNPYWVNF